ncbi:MAG: hypothetical protein WDW36_007649 [Sanguina aurantia]
MAQSRSHARGSLGNGSAARGPSTATAAAAAAALQAGMPDGKKKGGPGGGLSGENSPSRSASGSEWSEDDSNVCSICMDLPVAVLVAGCRHGLCVQCAFQLCTKGRELPCCPFCRCKIAGFLQVDDAGRAPPGVPPPPPAQQQQRSVCTPVGAPPRSSVSPPEGAGEGARRVIPRTPGGADTLVAAV